MPLLPTINDSSFAALRTSLLSTKTFGPGALTLADSVRSAITTRLAGGGLGSRTIAVLTAHRARINAAVGANKGHQAMVACHFFLRDFKRLVEP